MLIIATLWQVFTVRQEFHESQSAELAHEERSRHERNKPCEPTDSNEQQQQSGPAGRKRRYSS